MKNIHLLFLLFTSLGFSQIPAGYYDTATGTEYTLKTQLYNIINGHTDNGYSGLYVTYTSSDRDIYFENNGTILDMYSEKPSGIDSYEYTYEIENPDDRDPGSGGAVEGQYYNREHIVPQGIFNSASPMGNDAHFVVPSDKFVNAQRGNFPFGVVDSPNWTSTNGSKRGNNLNSGYSAGYSGTVFEPINEFKGDIARMYFYFATRYENVISGYSYTMFDGSSDHAFEDTFLNILYQWHTDDPVSQREIDRNNAIYVRQNNRNPYIDHPEYVLSIWNTTLSTSDFNRNSISMYPNPVKTNTVHFKTTKDLEVIVYDVLGKQILTQKITSSKNTVNVANLNKGIYIVRLISEYGEVTKKLIKQ